MPIKPKAKAFKRVVEMNILDIPHTMSQEDANKALDAWFKEIGRK